MALSMWWFRTERLTKWRTTAGSEISGSAGASARNRSRGRSRSAPSAGTSSGPSLGPRCSFTEVGRVAVRERDSGHLRRTPREKVRLLQRLRRDVAHALRAEERQVDRVGERHQSLIRADVRGRALAADVLLAGLKREHESAASVLIDCGAREPARQTPDV